MVVDVRRDHSFRVPRVDYTLRYGIPNACTTPCHEDKSVKWANDAVVKWYGPTRTRGNDYVAALTAARKGLPEAERLLRAAVLNAEFPPIARATALESLAGLLSPASMGAVYAGLKDDDAIVRATAARMLEQAPAADQWRLGSALLTDPVRLVQVLTNLLNNAHKYTPENGKLSLRVSHQGEFVRFDVHDNGIGISEEDQKSLFSQFFRSENPQVREQQGWGLGLNLANRLVYLMGGEMGMQSALGEGSTFWFSVPTRQI